MTDRLIVAHTLSHAFPVPERDKEEQTERKLARRIDHRKALK